MKQTNTTVPSMPLIKIEILYSLGTPNGLYPTMRHIMPAHNNIIEFLKSVNSKNETP